MLYVSASEIHTRGQPVELLTNSSSNRGYKGEYLRAHRVEAYLVWNWETLPEDVLFQLLSERHIGTKIGCGCQGWCALNTMSMK